MNSIIYFNNIHLPHILANVTLLKGILTHSSMTFSLYSWISLIQIDTDITTSSKILSEELQEVLFHFFPKMKGFKITSL